jgi:thimet oligopeptidase
LDAFAEETLARTDLYRALDGYAARREVLSGEKRLLLERELADWRGQGAGLDREARLELRFVRERLAARERGFFDNLEWPRAKLLFSPEELAGLPQGSLQTYSRQGRLLQVEAEPDAYQPFMASVRDPTVRQRMEFLFHSRAAASNGPVLREILALRGRVADLLGSSSYAQLAMSGRLVSAPGRASALLKALAKRLRPSAKAEISALAGLKRRDAGPHADHTLRGWERDYYLALQRQALYPRADDPAVAESLSTDTVTDGVEPVLGRLLGLSLRRVPDAAVWHPDVTLNEVRDVESGELLGYFYLDLYARPGKPQRPAVFILAPGRSTPEGGHRPAVCVLWGSLAQPLAGGAALLRHGKVGDLEDLFHGLGHVLAVSLSRTDYARFSAAGLSPDALEIPALLLGRLAWRPEIVAAVSGHVRDRSRPLPPELLAEVASARAVGWSLRALDQTAFALVDLELHEGKGASDPGAVYRRDFSRLALDPVTPGTHPESSAAALVRDGAGASGPVLAALLAEELWRRWDEEGLFNPASGRHLRETIFAVGAEDAARGLHNFLGRDPGYDATPAPEAWPAAEEQDGQAADFGPPWRRRLIH